MNATGLSTVTFGYDELSQRTSMTDGTGASSYSYDRMGRMTQANQPNGVLAYGYDVDSNRTSLTYPGSLQVTYGYSNAGHLTSVSDWGPRQTTYTYTAAGLPHTVSLPNGLLTTYTYDRAHRLTGVTNAIGQTTITSHAYTLDNEGNRTALSEFVSGITAGAADTFGMTYDGLERLTAVTTTNPETFTLDAASNLTARTGPSKTYSIDGAERPTSDGTNVFVWSTADRLVSRGADTFGYDALARLTSSTVAGTSRSYGYNGDGLVQSRTSTGSSVTMLWDSASNPARLAAAGSDLIVYGLGPLYSVNGTTVTTYARDGLKSIRAEMNGSTVTGSWRYLAYGEIAQSNGASMPTSLGYAGQLLDPSGLYNMRARWYDPGSARFLTRDPLALPGATPGLLNPFSYALGNPASMTDPTGTCPMTSFLICPEPIIDPILTGYTKTWTNQSGRIDDVFTPWLLKAKADEGKDEEPEDAEDDQDKAPEHQWIPKGKQQEIDIHEIKRKHKLPKGVDLAWDEYEGNVCAHAKGRNNEVSGECDPIASWGDLVDEFPGRKGPQ